ncbi:hypothetical protein [Amycolatopsis tolypomycina]|nr:hypothetical protein [Amycolatopsis tolypomycina]
MSATRSKILVIAAAVAFGWLTNPLWPPGSSANGTPKSPASCSAQRYSH